MNLKKIAALVAILSASAYAYAQEDISLNGEWQFNVPGITETVTVNVPHTYNVMDGLEDYAGKAVYKRTLPLPENLEGKKVRVDFRGVYHDAIVRINGVEAGRHSNAGYTAFSMDISPYLDLSGQVENVIEVECDNSYSDTNIPWKRHFDWANDGGIYRPVTLHISGEKSIRYLHVNPEIDLSDSTAVAHISLRLHESSVKKAVFQLRIKENSSGRYIHEGDYKLKICKDGTFKTAISCGKVKLWHFDDPNLYSYEIELYDGKERSDFRREIFGFRKIEIIADQLFINGEAVRLPGIEDMPGSHPNVGMAESAEDIEEACMMMKELGATITRYHWGQDEHRMHMMDSLGILVQEEIPWWQGPYDTLGDTLTLTVQQQLQEMIESHYNHPCIWAWGLSNEVGDNRSDLLKMKAYAQQFDTTRYYLSMSNHIYHKFDEDPPLALDVPTWNDYTGTWHADHRDQLSGLFKLVEPVLDGRPLLITEAGLCEPAFTGGDARRIDEMIFHLEEWKKHPYVIGYIYFCLTDYRTQMGEEGFGRHRIRRHGVSDKYRNPKPSYYMLQQLMCPLEVIGVQPYGQKKIEGSLANQYELNTNTTSALIRLRVKDDIPSYTIRGYRLTYEDNTGQKRIIELPDLAPGESMDLIMENINHSFNFQIERKDGTFVMKY